MQPILTDKSVINLLPIASKIKPKSLHIYILQEMLLYVFRYGDHMVLIGNRKLMEDNNISVIETVDLTLNKFETQGKTAILAAIDNKLAGIIAFADTIKDNAKDAIDSLKSMGIEVVMLTGDNERAAKAVASN